MNNVYICKLIKNWFVINKLHVSEISKTYSKGAHDC